jgi:hypothetical protein
MPEVTFSTPLQRAWHLILISKTMGGFVSIILGFIPRSVPLAPVAHHTSSSGVSTPCQTCSDRCPLCFDFLAQIPHEHCGIWYQTQAPIAKMEGWSCYLKFKFDPAEICDLISSVCTGCRLLRLAILPYRSVWEEGSSARLSIAGHFEIQFLKGSNSILNLELTIKQGIIAL